MWPLRRLYHYKKFTQGPFQYGIYSALGVSSSLSTHGVCLLKSLKLSDSCLWAKVPFLTSN